MSGALRTTTYADDVALRDRLKGLRVVVAGADGFLGCAAVLGLLQMNATVSVISRRDQPVIGPINGSIIRGDLRDPAVARAAVESQDVVLDLLGFRDLKPNSAHPPLDASGEIIPQGNLMLACAQSKSKPLLLLTSSRLVYGVAKYLPVNEEHPTHPRSFYGAHKLLLENYLSVFRQTHDLRSVIIRLSSPFGPVHEFREDSFGVLNMFIRLALQGRPIRIFGDGRQERDYVFVDDVMHAILWCLVEPRCVNQTFNFGGPKGISMLAAAETVVRIVGRSHVEFAPWPAESLAVETGTFVSDTSKIRSILPLDQTIPFEDGMRITIEDMKQRL